MRALAKQLYTEANAILESSAALEAKVSAIGEGLGIYESEILGIIQQGRNTLNVNRESVLELAQGILKKLMKLTLLSRFILTLFRKIVIPPLRHQRQR